MNLMFRKKGIVYLSKTHISLYYKDIINPLRVDFDRNILENPTHNDKEWLQNSIKILENKVKLRRLKAVLILSKDLVFDKIIDEENPDKRILEINEFLAGLPIGVDLVEDKEFVKEGNVLVTATNKKLYESFIEVLKPLNIDIEYVLPEIVFNRVEFTKPFLEEIFNEKVLLKFGNYLENTEKSIIWNRKTIAIVASVILTGGFLMGFGIYKVDSSAFMDKIKNLNIETTRIENNTNNNQSNNEANNNNTESQNESNNNQEIKPEVDKTTIDVAVFNGTGIPGFAGEIATLVKGVGYTKVTTANASNFNYTNTIIEIDEKLPLDLVAALRESLKTKLKSFEIKQSKDLNNKIIITTGEVIQSN